MTATRLLPRIEAVTGTALSRILADAGYKGHNAPEEHTFKVYTQDQKRGVTEAIRRQFKRRGAVEPVIGHCKEDHRMGRNFLAHRDGDASNAVLAAAGYNFRRLLAWFGLILLGFWIAIQLRAMTQTPEKAEVHEGLSFQPTTRLSYHFL